MWDCGVAGLIWLKVAVWDLLLCLGYSASVWFMPCMHLLVQTEAERRRREAGVKQSMEIRVRSCMYVGMYVWYLELSREPRHVAQQTRYQNVGLRQSMEWIGSIRWIHNPVQSMRIWIGLDQKFTNSADSGLDWIQKCTMCITYLETWGSFSLS